MTTPDRSSGNVQLAARLREERRRIGLSQAAMAEALNTSLSSQKRYENDERKPDASYLIALEKLGIDTAFVLTGERKSSQQLDLSGLGETISPEVIADKVLAIGDKRSAAYRRGLVDVLAFRLNGTRIQCPYQPGTAKFDAYFAGNERGHFQWRLMVDGAWKPN